MTLSDRYGNAERFCSTNQWWGCHREEGERASTPLPHRQRRALRAAAQSGQPRRAGRHRASPPALGVLQGPGTSLGDRPWRDHLLRGELVVPPPGWGRRAAPATVHEVVQITSLHTARFVCDTGTADESVWGFGLCGAQCSSGAPQGGEQKELTPIRSQRGCTPIGQTCVRRVRARCVRRCTRSRDPGLRDRLSGATATANDRMHLQSPCLHPQYLVTLSIRDKPCKPSKPKRQALAALSTVSSLILSRDHHPTVQVARLPTHKYLRPADPRSTGPAIG